MIESCNHSKGKAYIKIASPRDARLLSAKNCIIRANKKDSQNNNSNNHSRKSCVYSRFANFIYIYFIQKDKVSDTYNYSNPNYLFNYLRVSCLFHLAKTLEHSS